MISLGIIVWLLQSILAFVVLMNFLIAIVSDAYADIMDKREQVDYAIKADLTLESLETMNSFNFGLSVF